MDAIIGLFKKTGYLLYLINPYEHMYEKTEDVPDYYKEVTPVFVFTILIEQLIRYRQGKSILRLNDTITNVCQGFLFEIMRIPVYGMELVMYTWVYSNWRIITLPWYSVWTWLLGLVAADFCFYWMHRATHQVSILWTLHEAHHSSEEFNLTVPMRNHIFMTAFYWVTYLPMAFAIPPSIYFVHYQMNIVYQYWLHTEVIPPLGFVELIFVTPSHHRVHHGRNQRCIDKNFGSFLIIWDKLFGTFEPEGKEKITYGLTHPLTTFNPLAIQTNHLSHILRLASEVKGFRNKLSAFLKGPGWSPGKPWMGNLHDIPEPGPETEKYNPKIPQWMTAYSAIHFLIILIGYLQLILNMSKVSSTTLGFCSLYILLSIMSFGFLLNGSVWVPAMELFRCPLYFLLDALIQKEIILQTHVIPELSLHLFRVIFLMSSAFWIMLSFSSEKKEEKFELREEGGIIRWPNQSIVGPKKIFRGGGYRIA